MRRSGCDAGIPAIILVLLAVMCSSERSPVEAPTQSAVVAYDPDDHNVTPEEQARQDRRLCRALGGEPFCEDNFCICESQP